jgi:hypothetical protein
VRASTAFLLAWLAAGSASAQSTVLLSVVGDGVDAARARMLEATLRGELRRADGVQLLSEEDTRRGLDAAAAMELACEPTDPACAAQLGALCGAERVVSARLAPEADALRVELALLDVASADTMRTTGATVSSGDLAAELRVAVAALYAPEPETPAALPPPPVEEPAAPAGSPLAMPLLAGGGALAGLGALSLVGAGVSAWLVYAPTDAPGAKPEDALAAAKTMSAVFYALAIGGGVMLAAGAGAVGAGVWMGMSEEDEG